MTIWVRYGVLEITSSNLEFLLESEESLWDKVQEINIRIGIVEILYVIQEFVSEVAGSYKYG